MTELYAAVAGHRATALRITVGTVGPWVAECSLEDDSDVMGRVDVTVGDLTLSGTVSTSNSGVFGGERKVVVIGGANGWGVSVPAKDYHNDARVKASTVAEDAARAVGETIGAFVPVNDRVGIDYVRQVGPASRALEDVAGGAPWWVDYKGVTNVGPRNGSTTDAYEVLAYDPGSQRVTLGVESPGDVVVGSILSKGLDGAKVVRQLEIIADAGEVRLVALCVGTEERASDLPGLMRAIIERATDGRLWGKYRYRVIRMASERVELQAARKAAGLPDVLPVSMWPGVAGAHAELAPGAEVLVEFVEGDRAQPVVTHFAGKGGPGWVPVSLTLGGATGAPAARQGDAVEVLLPPAVFSGAIGGVPSTGVLTFVLNKTLGTITGGSGKVKVAT